MAHCTISGVKTQLISRAFDSSGERYFPSARTASSRRLRASSRAGLGGEVAAFGSRLKIAPGAQKCSRAAFRIFEVDRNRWPFAFVTCSMWLSVLAGRTSWKKDLLQVSPTL